MKTIDIQQLNTKRNPIMVYDDSLDLSELNKPCQEKIDQANNCLLYTSPSPRDRTRSRMPSSA